ncbi:8158_t:CDS:2 [Funneliformis geosporum]|uniref:16110_t:CDS:1 n=1 Tax=Funneliformis geosporum TaxID=1117311 RepID=A0A9W4WVQ4_9GLOM|nr:8158_t:CDS:2 [Funneliformis geosporum]CAI2182558.1 16110_t:CDS:2 [Funneliformis geosporum]
MPCNLNTICYIDQHNKTAEKSKFIANVVEIISFQHQNINIFIHITAFYPKNTTQDTDLERFKKEDIIQVQGRFSVTETDVDDIGIVSDNPEVSDDKITLNITAKEYLNDQLNSSLLFNLYYFPEETHLLSISTKALRSSSLYITGHLSFIENFLLIKITQINFIESFSSLSYKPSNYAWKKKQINEPSS